MSMLYGIFSVKIADFAYEEGRKKTSYGQHHTNQHFFVSRVVLTNPDQIILLNDCALKRVYSLMQFEFELISR